MDDATRLAGVTCVDLQRSTGPRVAYLFDPHRLALPAWAHALEGHPPAVLLTIDRHTDTVPPERPHAVPHRDAGLRALDEHARWELRTRNTDHILAAMAAGLISHAVCVARTSLPEAVTGGPWVDPRGVAHEVRLVRTIMALSDGGPEADELSRWMADAPVVLDIDLDAFTSASDADPTEVLPWPTDAIRRFLRPDGSEAWWRGVLERCVAVTMAREPAHCGGVVAAGRLMDAAAPVVWTELLGVDAP